MEPRVPHDEFMKAAEARAKLRDRAEGVRQDSRRARFRWLFWGLRWSCLSP